MFPLPQQVGVRLAASLMLLATLGAQAADAQIGNIRDRAGRLTERTPDLSRLLEGEPPITTSLEHARFAVDSLDNFSPRAEKLSITRLERTPNGGFVLQPGYWEIHTQSYCLKAGTHGPGGGDGYIYAPPLGPADEAVVTILRNSVAHPEIPQQSIQVLLWAIIARTKVEDMSAAHKATAARLLSPQQLAMLNRNALDLLPGPVLTQALARVPGPIRQVLVAEAELRRMMTSADASFDDMERVAVLAGMAPRGEGSRDVPSGRWSRHPDGYYVRYLPRGYSYTITELWVPEGSDAVGKEYDPALHVAVPGNTARQRLIQSGRLHRSE
jgi:hypothetical protein